MKFIKRSLAVLLALSLLTLPPQAASAENAVPPVTEEQTLSPAATNTPAQAEVAVLADIQVQIEPESLSQGDAPIGSDVSAGSETPVTSDTPAESSSPAENMADDSGSEPDSIIDTSDQDIPDAASTPSETAPMDQGESLPENAQSNASIPTEPYAENIMASGRDNNINWAIDGEGKLTVSGSGDFSVPSDPKPWQNNAGQITSAEINITGMTDASYLFSGCSRLTNVNLQNFDTSNITNMYAMFASCISLRDLDVRSFNTSNVENMDLMFFNCDSLQTLDLSNFNTSNVTSMWGMFDGCQDLQTLNLSSFNTSNVTSMRDMFSDCRALQTLDLSNFNTSSVVYMNSIFEDCRSLQTLDLSNFDLSNTRLLPNMFSNCHSLQSINLSNVNTPKAENMSNMFSNCRSLKTLDVSSFNTSNIHSMDNMFSGCSALETLDVSSFDTSNVTNMRGMFNGLHSLHTLDVSSFNTSNVYDMCNMFSNCSSIQELDLSGFNASNVTNIERILAGCNALTILHTPYNLNNPLFLPIFNSYTVWRLPDGTEVTELSEISGQSITVTRYNTEMPPATTPPATTPPATTPPTTTPPATTPPATTPPATVPPAPEIITTTADLNMPSVIRVKYVPYSCTLQTNNTDENNIVTFSLESGRLAEGLQLYPATGEIYGMPLEAGQFPITVKASFSNPAYEPSYADLMLIVLENTNENIADASDPGYELTQSVPDLDTASLAQGGSHLLVSKGEYSEFLDVYLDGQKLAVQTDYTAESGSTRITILNQTLARNGAGSHTLSVEFRTQDTNVLRRAAQNYTVSETDNSGSEKPGNEPGNDTPGDSKPGNDTPDNGNSSVSGSENSNPDDNTGRHESSENTADNTESSAAIVHYVKPYDTLWSIAVKYYGSGTYWRKIFADNADRIRNPNIIYTGQPILIYPSGENAVTGNGTGSSANMNSASGSQRTYSVQPGDNLWRISARVLGSWRYWDAIYQLNQNIIRDPRRLYPGQILVLPETPVSP